MESFSLETRKGTLAGLAFGPETGQPVLALHGWLDNAASFIPMARHLPPNIRLLALEFPGHGHSAHRPPGERYELVEYVEDVLVALDSLGWYRVPVIAHSLGAVVSGLLAGTFNERIAGMVWIDAIGPYVNKDEEAPAILRRAIEKRAKPGREGRVFPSVADAASARMQGFSPLTEESATLLAERNLQAVPGGYAWRTDARLRHPSMQRLNEAQTRAFLSGICCPTLLIGGSRGLAMMHASSPRPGYVNGLEMMTIEGGHHLHMEAAAAEVATAAFGFLARHGLVPAAV